MDGELSAGCSAQVARSEDWVIPILLTVGELSITVLHLKEFGKQMKFNRMFRMCSVMFTNIFQSQFITVISVRESYYSAK